MIVRRILGSCYLGFALFIVLSLFFGKGGLVNFRDNLEYKACLQANIEELEAINQTLALELKALSASPDTIKVAARDYGYFEKNEEVIKIQGAPEMKKYYKLGSLLKRNQENGGSGPVFHIIGLAGAAVAFAFSLTLLRRRGDGPVQG
jgi:cell division protein FtsB